MNGVAWPVLTFLRFRGEEVFKIWAALGWWMYSEI